MSVWNVWNAAVGWNDDFDIPVVSNVIWGMHASHIRNGMPYFVLIAGMHTARRYNNTTIIRLSTTANMCGDPEPKQSDCLPRLWVWT